MSRTSERQARAEPSATSSAADPPLRRSGTVSRRVGTQHHERGHTAPPERAGPGRFVGHREAVTASELDVPVVLTGDICPGQSAPEPHQFGLIVST